MPHLPAVADGSALGRVHGDARGLEVSAAAIEVGRAVEEDVE
eukprot:CAMPEP_0181181168 /NCGR_PEP_ID=MMETSP1096-20121128/7191_1 /TAXON_ID=156174 ORGANISM="Chrysochromulina ericina, Strain CCMP281" /NCGR_SAMPLE_ID=MMETSP1096 /ASSEMBLY_ACC=CAM_ASM_000453 /LENGTH=41 /DNA_ID= /DNA_START= /DNA_END= /DNA_ORIENTATION=